MATQKNSNVLEMTFKLDGTKTVSYFLADPKDGLTKAAVEGVMQDMITKKAILVKGVAPTAISGAVIKAVTYTALA